MENKKENITVNDKEVLVYINPKIYPLEVIYSAAYIFLEKVYVLLEGDSEKEVIVKLQPKELFSQGDLKKVGQEFFNELANYSFHKTQTEKNAPLREAILQQALIPGAQNSQICEKEEDIEDYLDDPEGIAVPWEEKYGKQEEANSSEKELKNLSDEEYVNKCMEELEKLEEGLKEKSLGEKEGEWANGQPEK